MLGTRLDIAPCSVGQTLTLERELGVSSTLAQVLVRRDLADPVAARAFLDAQEEHDPDLFAGMERAVQVIGGHIARGSQLTVHGDYDVDGVCSTALLLRALRGLGARVDSYLPDRATDGYGLNPDTVTRLAARGTDLLLCVDCAITAVDEVAGARAAGMDVVVCDHHAPRADGRLPDAPTVHPALGGYPFAQLCATAVAYKLALALYRAAGRDEQPVQEDLDLVGLATVADVVPLLGENRTLVRRGVRALATTAKPGLRALMDIARVVPSRVDERAVAFALSPRINAAGRLYRADAGLELMLTSDHQRAAEIADELDHANHERRHTETRILFEAESQVAELGERSAYVLAGEGWHPGVIGIVASRIAERHHRPTVVIALDGERGRGSARSVEGFDLLAALDACGAHLTRHGGHRAAAGLELERARVPDFAAALDAQAARTLTEEQLLRSERVDAIAGGDELGLDLAEELGRMAPFGCANPPVKLLLPAATFTDPRPMGEGRHVRFTVRAGGTHARAVGFRTGGGLPVGVDEPVDATFSLEANEYRGAVEPRLVLSHASACAPAPVTWLGQPAGYLEAVGAEMDGPLIGEEDRPGPQVRQAHDRRGRGLAGVLGALAAGGEPVLVVCADAELRLGQMAGRVGGFVLCSYTDLLFGRVASADFTHVALLDPPAFALADDVARAGDPSGHVHLLWGEPETAFAARVHERDHDLRPGLTGLYRRLRDIPAVDRADGARSRDRLAELLTGPAGRTGEGSRCPAALAGRLLRVMRELALVDVDLAAGRVELRAASRVDLDRSPTFRACTGRLQEGSRRLGLTQVRAA